MILTDADILRYHKKGNIRIMPFNPQQLNTNSYNLRLGGKLLVYEDLVLDPKKEPKTREYLIPDEGFVIQPGQLYLGATAEYTETHGIVPMVEGRSSIGRLGINVHATAGFGDAGFCGHWTLEISCIHPVRLYKGMEICQIYYNYVQTQPLIPYRGRYAKDKEPAPSRLYQDVVIDKSAYIRYMRDI